MMENRLYINGVDAYQTWGVYLADGSLNALMSPPPVKKPITNTSRVIDGVQVINTGVYDKRDISVIFNIKANGYQDLTIKISSFIETLRRGITELRTAYQPNTTYHLCYSSSTLTQTRGELGKLVVKFLEPNPANRS